RRQARLTKLLDGTLSSLQARFRETLIYFDSQVLGELHAEDFVAGELSAAMVIVNELTTLLTSHELYRRTESASRSSERERFKKIMQIEQDVDEAVSRLLRIRKPVDTKRTIDAA